MNFAKDSKLSLCYKDVGDKAFLAKKDKAAILYYSIALRFAPHSDASPCSGDAEDDTAQRLVEGDGDARTETLSAHLLALCLSNRSAALCQLGLYKECLSDIYLCLPIAPSHLRYKLLHRLATVYLKLDEKVHGKRACQCLASAIDQLRYASKLSEQRKVELTRKYQCDVGKLAPRLGLLGSARGDAALLDAREEMAEVLDRIRCEKIATEGSDALGTPCAGLVMCYEDSRGRFIKAASDIAAGTVLWQEEAFVTDVNSEAAGGLCHNCAVRTASPIPCPYCSQAQYCTTACCRTSWTTWHWLECYLSRNAVMPHWSQEARLALRLLLTSAARGRKIGSESSGSQNWKPRDGDVPLQCLKSSTYEGRLGLVESLVGHSEHRQTAVDVFTKEAKHLAQGICGLASCTDLVISMQRLYSGHGATPFTEVLTRADGAVLHHAAAAADASTLSGTPDARGDKHISSRSSLDLTGVGSPVDTLVAQLLPTMLLLQCNGHAITATMAESEISAMSLCSPDCTGSPPVWPPSGAQQSGVTEATAQVRLALAIFPLTSLLNHSCAANTHVRFQGNVISIVAARYIAAGSEVTHSYGVDAIRTPSTEKRREMLLSQYFFECTCAACCGTTGGRASSDAPGLSRNTSSMLMEASSLAEKGRSLQDSGNLPEASACLRKALHLQEKCLSKNDIALGYTHDCLANILYCIGDCVAAAGHSSQSLACVQHAYGEHSMQAANEHFKLCQLLFNSGDGSKFLQASKTGVRVMKQALGEQHADTQELAEMIRTVLASVPS